jgi:mannosyl-3-phosphoglycerate phosphatase
MWFEPRIKLKRKEAAMVDRAGNFVVFTDLDGTLLDHATYSHAAATEALDVLAERKVPVILCSSKTRAEIEELRSDLGLKHPFITENGGAVFLPRGYFPAEVPGARRLKSYEVLEFGAPYWRLVEALHRAAGQAGIRVLGFSDMSVAEVASECGLSTQAARLAKRREYDEPFRILEGSTAEQSRFFEYLHQQGFRSTRGGRFHHLSGVADKGQAVRKLKALYQEQRGKVTAIGLGDGLNDLSLLLEAEIAVIVRNPAADASSELLRKVPTARLTDAPGPQGWNEAILEILSDSAGPIRGRAESAQASRADRGPAQARSSKVRSKG